MRLFISWFKWIMLVSGVLTCTMLQGLINPESSLLSNFGTTLEGPLAEMIVRSWSALIGLMGVVLIYGAFVPAVRRFCLVIVGISKVVFILLLLTVGKQYLEFGVGTALVVDSVMVVLYAAYLIVSRLPAFKEQA